MPCEGGWQSGLRTCQQPLGRGEDDNNVRLAVLAALLLVEEANTGPLLKDCELELP
jgi:hypothetical protein